MKMNLKLRLQNKTTLIALITSMVTLVYQILAAVGVAPAVSESAVMNLSTIAVNALCVLGIVVDPTTKGISDSSQAMEYEKPKDGSEE